MDQIFNYERKQEDDYYYIIGCDELSNEEQILTEYKARVLSCHPDKHPDDPNAAEQFTKLQKVKEVLTDKKKRANYDKWRQSGVAMPYDQWCSLRDSVHVSMHWGTVKTKPMLSEPGKSDSHSVGSEHSTTGSRIEKGWNYNAESQSIRSEEYTKPVSWERCNTSETLLKFRNYDI